MDPLATRLSTDRRSPPKTSPELDEPPRGWRVDESSISTQDEALWQERKKDEQRWGEICDEERRNKLFRLEPAQRASRNWGKSTSGGAGV